MPQLERKSPAEVGLYLPPEVLRLDYPFATRAVLAEVLQLSRKDGQCSASDAHFVKRLGVSKNTASRAVQQLVDDEVLSVDYDTSGRLTRFLKPATDHPQNGGGADNDHPQNGEPTTPKMGLAPPPKWGTNKEDKKEGKQEVGENARARPGGEKKVGGKRASAEDRQPQNNPAGRRPPPPGSAGPPAPDNGAGNSFRPPTTAQVAALIRAEFPTHADPEGLARRFINWHSDRGWMVGKTKMQGWEGTARNWAEDDLKNASRSKRTVSNPGKPAKPDRYAVTNGEAFGELG